MRHSGNRAQRSLSDERVLSATRLSIACLVFKREGKNVCVCVSCNAPYSLFLDREASLEICVTVKGALGGGIGQYINEGRGKGPIENMVQIRNIYPVYLHFGRK